MLTNKLSGTLALAGLLITSACGSGDDGTTSATTIADDGGVRVVVDAASAPLLKGASLDYKDGLQGAGFAINNPNATRSCGCGSSFS